MCVLNDREKLEAQPYNDKALCESCQNIDYAENMIVYQGEYFCDMTCFALSCEMSPELIKFIKEN